MTRNYQGVCLPNELMHRIDALIQDLGYTSRTDFIKQAIRRDLERLEKIRKNKGSKDHAEQ